MKNFKPKQTALLLAASLAFLPVISSGENSDKPVDAVNFLSEKGVLTGYEDGSYGDFNVGITDNDELETLIFEKREKGIYLTVLGFGMGNYKDSRMEMIADCGNGNYAYIDNLKEAKRVLVDDLPKTLYSIADDVKFQAEFNPRTVAQYRLIGYENRHLENEDFDNDAQDAASEYDPLVYGVNLFSLRIWRNI